MWQVISPVKPIVGKGQSLAFTNGASSTATNAMGPQTYVVRLSGITANCCVRITNNGAAATATDLLIKSTDDGIMLGCSPGDKVSAWGLGAGTLYIHEMTH